MVATSQTFGDLVHFHPHVHSVVPEGIFTENGHFVHIPDIWKHKAEKIFAERVFVCFASAVYGIRTSCNQVIGTVNFYSLSIRLTMRLSLRSLSVRYLAQKRHFYCTALPGACAPGSTQDSVSITRCASPKEITLVCNGWLSISHDARSH